MAEKKEKKEKRKKKKKKRKMNIDNPIKHPLRGSLTRHSINVMYVPTKDNPADYLSRGCTSKQLKSSNWLHGPSWLLTGEYPEQTNIEVVVNELTVEVNPIHPIQPLIDLTRFSSVTRQVLGRPVCDRGVIPRR